MTKKSTRNIKGWIIMWFSLITVFIVLPWVCWTGYRDDKNLKQRGKEITATVVEIKGLERKPNIVFEYYFNGLLYRKTRQDYSKKLRIGDSLIVICDSLVPETVMIKKSN